jgi:4-hydroxy-2-oxoheptanedioate aldolase
MTARIAWRADDRRSPLLNAWLTIPDAYSCEVVAAQGFDCVTIDMQHGLIDYQAALQMLRAASWLQKPALVRVPSLDPGTIAKVLDAGALGIVCPQVETRDEAERLVAATRYPPLGLRSFGPSRALLSVGEDYFRIANSAVLLLAMIETAKGLENLPAILSVAGLDGIYIGPSDLSISLGFKPGLDSGEPAVRDAIESIRAQTQSKGLFIGISTSTAQTARAFAASGFDLVTIGTDAKLLANAARQTITEFQASAPRG